MRLFPVICGPTASGKSALAVELALHLRSRGTHAEIITADAFQVYRGLDIGTAKPTQEERRGVPHALIDVAEPTEAFTLDRWLALAEREIERVRAVVGQGGWPGVPIVVGGTHLYVKALLEGLFEGPAADAALRKRLNALEPLERRALLERADPAAAARIHPNDLRRTVRALEVHELTGRPLSEQQGQWDSGGARADALVVALQWPVEELNRRINARVKAMIAGTPDGGGGLIDEVRGLVEAGKLPRGTQTPSGACQAAQALGYKQLLPVVCAAMERGLWPPPPGPLEEAIERIKIETRRFAKNQRTWLKRIGQTPGAMLVECPIEPDTGVANIVSAIVRRLSPAG